MAKLVVKDEQQVEMLQLIMEMNLVVVEVVLAVTALQKIFLISTF